MQEFKFNANEIKNQCFYTCRVCFAHLYLQAHIEGEHDQLKAHDVDRDDCYNKVISLNRYTVACRCGAYLGFLHANRQTVCIRYFNANPIQSNDVTSTTQ